MVGVTGCMKEFWSWLHCKGVSRKVLKDEEKVYVHVIQTRDAESFMRVMIIKSTRMCFDSGGITLVLTVVLQQASSLISKYCH